MQLTSYAWYANESRLHAITCEKCIINVIIHYLYWLLHILSVNKYIYLLLTLIAQIKKIYLYNITNKKFWLFFTLY